MKSGLSRLTIVTNCGGSLKISAIDFLFSFGGLLLLREVELLLIRLGVWVEIGHIVVNLGMFESHVLSHGAFSAIGPLAVEDRTDILPLDLVGAPPHPLLLLFGR